jgi:hypothetical protein
MKDWWDTGGEAWAGGIADTITTWAKTIGDYLKSGEAGTLVQEAALWLEDAWNALADWWDIYTGDLTDRTVAGIDYWITNTLVPALKETDKTKWSAGLGEAIMLGFAGVDEWVDANADQIGYDVGYTMGKIILLGVKGAVEALALLASDPITLIFKQWQEQGFATTEGVGLDLGWLSDFAAQIATGIEDAFKNDETVQRLWAQGAAIVKVIADGMAGGWATAIENWADEFLDAGGELIKGVAAGITRWSVTAVEAIEKAAGDIVQGIKDFFGIASPSTVMAGIGADLVAGLKDGIVEASRDFYDWIVGWAKRIIPQPLWKFFGIESPSKLMAEMGRNLVLGLAQGIQQTGPVAASAMAGVMGGFGTPNLGSMRFSPAFASGASGGSLGGTGISITNNIYTNGGSADAVRTAANTGTLEALRARGYR